MRACVQELHLEVGIDVDLHGKVLLIQKALREKLAEVGYALQYERAAQLACSSFPLMKTEQSSSRYHA